MSRLAQLIAKEEGFGVAGTLPTRNHNPGDLRHSPHSVHSPMNPDGIGIIATDEEGWADLERQLALFAKRGLSLRQMVEIYAPPSDNNRTEQYLRDLLVGLFEHYPVASALLIPASSGLRAGDVLSRQVLPSDDPSALRADADGATNTGDGK